MDLGKHFRVPLYESGRGQTFKNILFLSKDDKKYLSLLGKVMFNKFNNIEELEEEAKYLERTSFLYKTMKAESAYLLEDIRQVYWNGTLDEDKYFEGFKLCTIDERRLLDNNRMVKPLFTDNVVLYLPVLYDWIRYYKSKMDHEPFEIRETIHALEVVSKVFAENKSVVMKSHKYELVEEYK